MFTPSSLLLKYLNSNPRNAYNIIGALEGYISVDPKFRTNDFEEAIKYVLANGVSKEELFQEFNSEMEYEEDDSKWDYDYYCLARVYLKENFCMKRVRHVQAVARKIYPNEDVQKNAVHINQTTVKAHNGGNQVTGKKQNGQHGKTSQKLSTAIIVGLIMLCVVLVAVIASII